MLCKLDSGERTLRKILSYLKEFYLVLRSTVYFFENNFFLYEQLSMNYKKRLKYTTVNKRIDMYNFHSIVCFSFRILSLFKCLLCPSGTQCA